MKLFNKILLVLLVSCIALFACVETPIIDERDISNEERLENTKVFTRSLSNETYEHLPNPYALSVMQEVYDTYSETDVTIEATDLYVKFMPKDSLELHTLKDDYNLELFDYPLDIELAEGEVYVNTELPEGDLAWVYTTVEPDFVFPSGISYEILEECYIPADDEMVGSPTRVGVVNVEDAAYALVGYDEGAPLGTRASATPSGTIRVYNDDNQTYVPVKGVKVRCHRIIKWATAYTDENGSYTMSKSFRYKPHYAIVFDNIKDFDIWGNWGPIARANHNLGWHSNTGYSANIEYNCNAWEWAVVNNSAYEYYQMCEETGILKPPANLKIWVWKNFNKSSAPMLRRITDPIGYNGNDPWLNYFINSHGYGVTATLLNQILKVVLPDITIGTSSKTGAKVNYMTIYQRVNHELAHASHFSKVGSPYWAKYVSYIMTYGAYGGNDLGHNAQLCAIGEMWGYSMGYIQVAEKQGLPLSIENIGIVDEWIYPHIFCTIVCDEILTKKQIYDCLTSEVDTYNELVSKLYTLYPNQAAVIEQILSDYPSINHNVSLPETDDIAYDICWVNRNVIKSTIINGENILIQNCTISNGVALVLNVGNSITVDTPFYVAAGSTLAIISSI